MTKEESAAEEPHSAHDGINGYGTAVNVSAGGPASLDTIRNYARELMKAVAARCVDSGAKDIGHIKAYMEGGGLFVYASAVGDGPDITVNGKGEGPAQAVSLTLNAVVYGIGKDTLKRAADKALAQVTNDFGFEITDSKL